MDDPGCEVCHFLSSMANLPMDKWMCCCQAIRLIYHRIIPKKDDVMTLPHLNQTCATMFSMKIWTWSSGAISVKIWQAVQGRHIDKGCLWYYLLRFYRMTPIGNSCCMKRGSTTYTTILKSLCRYHPCHTLRCWCSLSSFWGNGWAPSSGLGDLIYFQVGGYR